jgi:hypothetical protein
MSVIGVIYPIPKGFSHDGPKVGVSVSVKPSSLVKWLM